MLHDLSQWLSCHARYTRRHTRHGVNVLRHRAGAAPRPVVGLSRAGLRPQLTALFTSATIRASSSAVTSVSAKSVGHIVPSSRCALSLKPRVA